MDKNTLERLCVDFHLGEMNDDTQKLLNAYLSTHPGMDNLIHDVSSLLNRASQVLAPPVISPSYLPPLPSRVMQPGGQTFRQYRRTLARFAVAASLVLAFLLGTRFDFSRTSSPQQLLRAPEYVAESPSLSAPFWSLKNLSRLRSTEKHHTATIRWNSPLSLPELGEKS